MRGMIKTDKKNNKESITILTLAAQYMATP
jgi:hypothetical protein